jgi:Tol biopolymer transport system component/serine/threonine protein kinase
MSLASGTRLGPYQILDLLGAGGMGEVYRARDTRLDRTVAVKVLPLRFVNNAEQRARFEREARAISTLAHPRICTLYDIGEAAGAPFLVMEHLTGETLAAHLRKGPLTVARAVKIGVEIAEGLAAAHKHGIVHRDLKPGNVMLTPTGVKLLDFGLAKLGELDPGGAQVSATTMGPLADPLTAEGVIVGSRPYMAPEQLEGKPVDARTDLWALGVILYEMLTGRRAFSGHSAIGLTAAILEREPESLVVLRPDTPPALDRIVSRCLTKDPDARWFSAHDVAGELSWVAQTSGTGSAVAASGTPRRRTWRRPVTVAGVLLALVIAGAFVAWRIPSLRLVPAQVVAEPSRSAPSTSGLLVTRPRQVTSLPGWEGSPAISPDGSLIAYASNESGNPDIWLIGVGGASALRLTDDPGSDDKPCWYPDGRAIAFVSTRDGSDAIWKVPVLGGSATPLVPNASDPAIDASGTRIAFVRSERIAVAALADPTKATVLTRDGDGLWNHRDPAWSPDGGTIVYAAQRGLWTVPSAGGRATPLTTDDEADEEPVWSGDGRFVYFRSFREESEAIWRVAACGGTPQRVTLGSGPEGHPSLSRDGHELAFTTLTRNPDIVLRDTTSGAETTLPDVRGEYMPTFSPDGRTLLFVSERGGHPRIWQQPILNGRPSGAAQMLTEHQAAYPTYSPDGQWVAYYRVGQGEPRTLWIVPSAGGEPVRLTGASGQELYPAWSPKGTEIAYVSDEEAVSRIVLVAVRNGKAAGPSRVLASGPGDHQSPTFSPDGRFLAYAVEANGRTTLRIVRSDGTPPVRDVATGGALMRIRWSANTGSLLVSTQGGKNQQILHVDPAGGPLQPLHPPVLIDLNPELIDFDISRDGRWLTFCREAPVGDIWMAEVITQ